MRRVRFGVLGPLAVDGDGGPVAVGGPRPRALLTLLLLEPGRPVPVAGVIEAQYGGEPPAGAVNAVQAQVSRLRRALPGVVVSDAGGYRADVDPEAVDAHRFARLAREGAALLAGGRPGPAAELLREGLALWRGDACADLPGHPAAARLDDRRLAAVEDLAEADLALGRDPLPDLRRLVAAHPLRERAQALLMRALAAAGRPAEALTAHAALRARLADELGADPSPEVAAAHAEILAARPPRRALPAPLTALVGRTAELARLTAPGPRLVTVVGPGGAGKTRLAVEAARRTAADAVFVDLAALAAGDPVVPALLGALGVRGSGDPQAALVAACAGRELLLVLDNAEHVDAAGPVRALLAACPGVRVLVTSREPLGITGETLLPLEPLHRAAAAALFAERAAAVVPGFALGPDTDPAVAAIVTAVDGLPLGLELAAARLRQFPVAEVARRLTGHEAFALLTRGDPTAGARHRSMRAAVTWTWDLLGEPERAAARRFAAFAGGALHATAVALCGDEDVLADLVDRSVLVADGDRYRMLETIRLFCAERLAAAGEDEDVRRAHARHHLALARELDPLLRRREQLDGLARLSAEHADLVAALRWAAAHEPPTAAALVAALAAYGWFTGRGRDLGPAAAAVLDSGSAIGAEEYVACVVHAVPRAAPDRWERAREIVRGWSGPPPRHPFGVALWGMAVGPDPTPPPAGLLGTDAWAGALADLSTGLLDVLAGRPEAGGRLEAVLATFRGLGERWGTAQTLDWLAHLAARAGDHSRAEQRWAEALALLDELGAPEEGAELLARRAGARLERARGADPADRPALLDGAAADLDRAAVLAARAGRPDVPPEVAALRRELPG